MRTTKPPLRGALIGCGYVSGFHLTAWSRVLHSELVALCDTNQERLEQAGARMPQARRYTEAAEMFDREAGLDFVEICTPPEPHRELVARAAGYRAHILCQKPAALDRSDFCRHDRDLQRGRRAADDP